jgi:hypothetical protein
MLTLPFTKLEKDDTGAMNFVLDLLAAQLTNTDRYGNSTTLILIKTRASHFMTALTPLITVQLKSSEASIRGKSLESVPTCLSSPYKVGCPFVRHETHAFPLGSFNAVSQSHCR